MTDRFDAWLETGLRDLEGAGPLGQSVVGRLAPTGLLRVSGRRTRSLRPVGSVALAIAVILVVAVLLPRFDAAAPGASQSTVPSIGGGPPTPPPLSSPSAPNQRTTGPGPVF